MINAKVSQIIDLYRFPLAVLVVFIHFTGMGKMEYLPPCYEVSGYDIYSFVRILISRVVSQVAVPAFFLISGYLFYKGLEQWNWDVWWRKIKSRRQSLLVPYLLWITLYVLYERLLHVTAGGNFRLYDILFSNWYLIGSYYNCIDADTDNISWLGTMSPTCCPIFIPFWFIRDLMFMVILSPVIFFFLNRCGKWYIIVLLLAYVSQVWPVVPGLSIRAVCFFSLGGFLSLYSFYFPKVLIKTSYVVAPGLAILCCFCFGTIYYWYLLPWFVLSACLVLWDVGGFLVNKHFKKPPLLVKSTFFISHFSASCVETICSKRNVSCVHVIRISLRSCHCSFPFRADLLHHG